MGMVPTMIIPIWIQFIEVYKNSSISERIGIWVLSLLALAWMSVIVLLVGTWMYKGWPVVPIVFGVIVLVWWEIDRTMRV